jgi:phosphoglycolate phosphatase
VAAALGAPPSAIAFVGDTPIDLDTARAAGMLAVAVSWGFRDREELVAHGARAVIDFPVELLDLL